MVDLQLQSKQTNYNSQFSLYITVCLAAKYKMAVFWPKIITNNYTISSSIFWAKNCLKKTESLHLQQFSRPYLGIKLKFFLSLFSLDMLQPFSYSQYRVSQLGSFVLERNSGYLSHTLCVERLLFPFQSVGPPGPTSEILHLLHCLKNKTRPNCLGKSYNPSTERPERWLHSWTALSASKHV